MIIIKIEGLFYPMMIKAYLNVVRIKYKYILNYLLFKYSIYKSNLNYIKIYIYIFFILYTLLYNLIKFYNLK